MIGCPTGAIHRSEDGGVVAINDTTCIGCGTCAHSCPYENIVMVAIRDRAGRIVRDPKDREPIMKATKCDLCVDRSDGPACVQMCPQGATVRVNFKKYELIDSLFSRES
jgi:Fe-S-cluster-containing dehydrogenase component